jgi:N-acetylglutamate synthase-like GNAT family acetyltransferase
MELFFRKIISEDKEEIVNLFLETYKKEPWNENWNNEIAQKRINNLLENNSSENYCVVNKDNKIIGVMPGYSNYFIDRKELYIDEFFIDYDYQRKGIGMQFMDYIENEIRQKEYSGIILLTKRSFQSEYFYTKNGFGISSDMVLMYKNISK